MLTTTERKLLTLALDLAAFEAEADLAATSFARSLRQRGLPIIGRRKSGPSHRRTPRCGTAFSIIKEATGIPVLRTRALFGDGIPRRLLLRVSPAKPTSAALQF